MRQRRKKELPRDHRANFRALIASGGLAGLVDGPGLGAQVVERSAYNAGTGQLIVLSRRG